MTMTRLPDPPAARILVVDDEDQVAHLLKRILERTTPHAITVATDPRQALPLFRSLAPDLVILDLGMPGLSGFDVIRQLASRAGDREFLPILVVSGEEGVEARQRALGLGAADFVSKPVDGVELGLRVKHLLQLRAFGRRLASEVELVTAGVAAAEIEVASRLALVAEMRDYQSGAHVMRVGHAAALTARRLGLPHEQVELIRLAAPLHDIGKIGVPENLLLKTGALTLAEFDVVKSHTTIGGRLLGGSGSAIMQVAEEIALYHHENWDGTGYTPGLAGEAIPLAGRIVAVADVFDALVSARPYKKAWSVSTAIDWIGEARGRKFDPAVADAFLAVAAETDLVHPPLAALA